MRLQSFLTLYHLGIATFSLWSFFFLTLSPLTSLAHAQNKGSYSIPAVVYAGPGACEEGCAQAAQNLVGQFGLSSHLINTASIVPSLFKNLQLWVQPGGDAVQVAQTMTAYQMSLLRNWIYRGGKYIGFCAGAFFADTTVDDNDSIMGLGLLPGITEDYSKNKVPMIMPIFWQGRFRSLFFQDGPAFHLQPLSTTRVLAYYPNGAPSIIAFPFGKGRVILTAPHPEAPPAWFTESGLQDPDGPDMDIGVDLLKFLFQ